MEPLPTSRDGGPPADPGPAGPVGTTRPVAPADPVAPLDAADRPWLAPESMPDGPGYPGAAATGPVAAPDEPDRAVTPAPGPVRRPVPLRPMTVSDVLDGSFAILKLQPRKVLIITAVIVLPVELAASFLQRGSFSLFDISSAFSPAALDQASSGGVLVASYLGIALSALSFFFVGGALARLVAAWYGGGDITAGEALKASFGKTGPFLAAFLLLLPVKVASFCFFLLPALFVVPLLSLTAPVIVVEDLGPLAGIQRGVSLAWRRLFPFLGITLLATLLEYIVRAVLNLVPEVLAGLMDSAGIPFYWVVLGAGRALVSLITVPFLAGVAVLLYLDLRVRSEGLDLELEATDAFARAA